MRRRATTAMHKFIFARVLPAEKSAIQAAAAREGLSLSDFMRRATADAISRNA